MKINGTKKNFLFISVIIPCFNEERNIAKWLNSLIENEYPKEFIEILIVDGMSKDKSREITEEFCIKYKFVKLSNTLFGFVWDLNSIWKVFTLLFIPLFVCSIL